MVAPGEQDWYTVFDERVDGAETPESSEHLLWLGRELSEPGLSIAFNLVERTLWAAVLHTYGGEIGRVGVPWPDVRHSVGWSRAPATVDQDWWWEQEERWCAALDVPSWMATAELFGALATGGVNCFLWVAAAEALLGTMPVSQILGSVEWGTYDAFRDSSGRGRLVEPPTLPET